MLPAEEAWRISGEGLLTEVPRSMEFSEVPCPRPGVRLRRMEHEETHYDPNKVRRVEFFHEPPGRQHVRVTVEYVTGELKGAEGVRSGSSGAC